VEFFKRLRHSLDTVSKKILDSRRCMQEPNTIEIPPDIEQLEDKTAPSGLAALD